MSNEIIIKLEKPFVERLVKVSDGDTEAIVEKATDIAKNTLADMMVSRVHEKTTERVLTAVCNEISKQVVFRLRGEIRKAAKNATEVMLNELNTKRKAKAAVNKISVPDVLLDTHGD